MAKVASRRNALIGWTLWTLAKRRLRQMPREKPRRGRRIIRSVVAIAVMAALAALWTQRSRGRGQAYPQPPVDTPARPDAQSP